MPRRTTILPSLIAVTFIGRARLAKSQLKTLFRVRRNLPEDEIPEEILASVRWEKDEDVATQESAGYVPTNVDSAMGGGDSDTRCLHGNDDPQNNLTLLENLDPSSNDPDVIPLEYSGIAAADESLITPQEMMRSALEKLTPETQIQMTNEGGYVVRHGGFARDFGPALSASTEDARDEPNPSVYIFPHLFPYGVGGLEAKRKVPVSFVAHVRCLLQRHDFRFRKDSIFAFWALSLEQKRQALQAAQLTTSRKDFDRVCGAVGQLKSDDYRKAALDEERGLPTKDPKIALLKKTVRITMQKVMGSDASRALNRSKIWSTSLFLNPVNLWITLNFVDRHDPICQVFAGQNIDMDDLNRAVNISAQTRAINVAQDPFAATQFFFFLSKTVLRTLFGFSTDNRVGENGMGELGKGSAYFGAVEAQGRGSLHLHLMMWLANSPDADEITCKLQSPDFREKIKTYMRRNIRSHLDGLTKDALDSMEPESAIAWGRPPNPDSPNYDKEIALLEIQLVRAQQYHRCTPNTCLKYDKRKHRLVCKRNAPFELSPEDVVTETGEIRTKRTVDALNTWCPAIFYGGRCNNDIKFITNGAVARAIAWYITFYATKKQGTSYNQSAIIEKTHAFQVANTVENQDARERNRQFIFRCGMSLNREMEFSGQQAMAYLMGYGDTINSHTYVTIWWSSVVSALKQAFPELAPPSSQSDNNSISREDQLDVARIEFTQDGNVYLRSQIDDYRFRAAEFESSFFLDYFVNTYEERTRKQSATETEPSTLNEQTTRPARHGGRLPNTRARYQIGHPRVETHQRVLRTPGHRTLPNIVGPWFERSDNPSTRPLYCASVLAALKPWRKLTDLKDGFDSWDEALEDFLQVANPRQKSIRANMQYYYQCQQSATEAQDGDEAGASAAVGAEFEDEPEEIDLQEYINGIELDDAILSRSKQKEIEHAEKAAQIGLKIGIFGSSDIQVGAAWTVLQEPVTNCDGSQITEWTQALRQAALQHQQNNTSVTDGDIDIGEVDTLETELTGSLNDAPTVTYEGNVEPPADIDISGLSTEQLRAFEIVRNHYLSSKAGDKPKQLLMQIQGAGGTGKSLVISKITELFTRHGQESKLRKSAYTGIAATLIEGSTLHQLALLHLCGKVSKKTIERLRTIWEPVEYLIIDEISMVSKKILAEISQMISIGKQKEGENNSTVAFGGVNVIIAGDFHQFPPVIGGSGNGALYTPIGPTATNKMLIGRLIYEQFRTVVLLKKQFRVEDESWSGVLARARHGKCTAKDLTAIKGLILDPARDKNLLTQPGWSDAVLVTPRHTVRHRWNELASYNHCRSTGQPLFLSHAYDTHSDKPLDTKTRSLLRAQTFTGKAADGTPAKGDPGGLPDIIPVAIGMKVMVTYNIETELDVANGARGTVVRIIANDEPTSDSSHIRQLSRPPLCVLVKLWRTRIRKLGNLDEGVVPIVPIRTQFKLKLPNKRVLTIYREQLPLTPAYAFTDYRSQGQTIPYIIMDLATPPSDGLTPFNGYVTLSRSRAARTARLLRDFDEKLFTTPPDQSLLSEDERLEELDLRTANGE
ncbi:ATP-dependent helicase RRM3 [Rhizoctonia solani AG-1 IB]|uniref:ATP-dependent DNA helicase n=1 Tax=Thanatephorus cucumeris (strain AG1-IB / isolate 7/3/14) TaxID=1108050 RepID=M5C5Y2_THACB|nr:ATP-dependent helicase RRM3 [Rhizoctonia solani AG-1 IB]